MPVPSRVVSGPMQMAETVGFLSFYLSKNARRISMLDTVPSAAGGIEFRRCCRSTGFVARCIPDKRERRALNNEGS